MKVHTDRKLLSCKTVAAGNSAYFTCPETSLVISNMLTCFLPPKTTLERVIGVDQSPLVLVLQLVLLDISSIAFWSDHREASPKVQTARSVDCGEFPLHKTTAERWYR